MKRTFLTLALVLSFAPFAQAARTKFFCVNATAGGDYINITVMPEEYPGGGWPAYVAFSRAVGRNSGDEQTAGTVAGIRFDSREVKNDAVVLTSTKYGLTLTISQAESSPNRYAARAIGTQSGYFGPVNTVLLCSIKDVNDDNQHL